jgi:hypothetical protein
MRDFFSTVAKAERIRCRDESEGNYLLYNPRTDQLHLLDARGKCIFDLCDGRAIDDVVNEGAQLSKDEASPLTPEAVLEFLCSLRRRDLVVMH